MLCKRNIALNKIMKLRCSTTCDVGVVLLLQHDTCIFLKIGCYIFTFDAD